MGDLDSAALHQADILFEALRRDSVSRRLAVLSERVNCVGARKKGQGNHNPKPFRVNKYRRWELNPHVPKDTGF